MSEVNYEALTRPFPREAIKQRKGASGKMLSYVEAHSVIRRLVEATSNNFQFRVLAVDIQDNLVLATVELEIAGNKRQHVGTQRMNGGNNDDAVKAAISDAIKKCATLWGVGLELYGPDYEAEQPQAVPTTRPVQALRQSTAGNGNNGNGHREPVGATNGRRVGFRPIQQDN